MSARRAICLLIGAWIGATALVALSAVQSFRAVDLSLDRPSRLLTFEVDRHSKEAVRTLFRYQASEQNRLLFESWGLIQFGVAALLFMALLFATRSGRIPILTSILLLILVGVMHFLVTPQITAGGRALDFVPQTEMAAERTRLASIHRIYSVMEGIKVVTLIGLGAWLSVRRKPGR
ncbi:MAG TPA: hypothetical protein DEH78_04850 [Solibacterales bacterium]|nr:hypothetical protein [Bryobacterales bacterium]